MQVSSKELLNITCRLAESLKIAGCEKNDVISVCSENCLEFFYPVIAALYLGIVIAPMNHDYSEGELLHSITISKPKIIFCSKDLVLRLLKLKQKVKLELRIIVLASKTSVIGIETLKEFMDTNSNDTLNEHNFQPIQLNTENEVAVILSSSGTTGLPKAVMVTHENINMRLNQVLDSRMHKQCSDQIQMGLLPFFHSYGFISTLGAILANETVVLLPKFEPISFLKTIETYKISNLFLVPPILVFLAKHPLVDNFDLSSVKDIISGAAPLGRNTEELVKKRLKIQSIRQGYGLTETTLCVLLMPEGKHSPGSSGPVVPGMTCKLRDPVTGITLGPNQVGELCFKGKLVTKGYYNNDDATRTLFHEGWLLTGDLAYYNTDGYFYIVDRLKELIKYKGFQVAPAELEALLLSHPKILDVGVSGIPDEAAGELTVAFIVKQPSVHLTKKEVTDFVDANISHSKRLHGGVEFVDAIPKTTSGKILRRKLKQMVQDVKSKL